MADQMIVKKYDVAISFLVQDLAIAQAVRDRLNEGLDVFFFPHNQEELAGTDGLESMRAPFLFESRVNVVIYREKWGNTPWTRVEETAIKEACLDQGWDGLFFFMMEPKATPPKWLPRTLVRLNYGDFTLDQAVGAIKLRVQEQGGRFLPMTAARRVQILKAEDEYRFEKSQMDSSRGMAKIAGAAKELLSGIANQISGAGLLGVETEIHYRDRISPDAIIIRNESISMIVAWRQPYTNSLQKSGLHVEEYNGRLIFDSEMGRLMYLRKPDMVGAVIYDPEISRSGDYGWVHRGKQEEFITSSGLSEKCAIHFIDFIERYNAGKIRKIEW